MPDFPSNFTDSTGRHYSVDEKCISAAKYLAMRIEQMPTGTRFTVSGVMQDWLQWSEFSDYEKTLFGKYVAYLALKKLLPIVRDNTHEKNKKAIYRKI